MISPASQIDNMKPFIKYVKSLPFNASGMALFPFVLLSVKDLKWNPFFTPSLINHEKIHIQQQLELGVIPFYILYVISFIVNYIRFGNTFQAYYNIPFEREAFRNQYNLTYLHQRKLWSWIKY